MVMIPVSAVTSVIVTKRAKGSEKRSTAALFFVIGSILFFVLMELAHFILSVKVYHNSEERMDTLPSFTVTSDDLHDGVWDAVITHSDGRDLSPQLSWEPVEGATAYGILMVDPDGGDWLHWKTGIVATAGVPQGYALPDTYIDSVSSSVDGGWREHPHFYAIQRMFAKGGQYEPFEDVEQ